MGKSSKRKSDERNSSDEEERHQRKASKKIEKVAKLLGLVAPGYSDFIMLVSDSQWATFYQIERFIPVYRNRTIVIEQRHEHYSFHTGWNGDRTSESFYPCLLSFGSHLSSVFKFLFMQ